MLVQFNLLSDFSDAECLAHEGQLPNAWNIARFTSRYSVDWLNKPI